MPLSGSTVFEVRTTGSDLNGGGYSSGGTDLSQQDSPQYSVTDGVSNGTATITSATANFGTDVVGNIAYVQGGTGSIVAGWYQIISRANSTTIVVDRATGLTTGTGVTIRIGGALATPGLLSNLMTIDGMTAHIRSGTYTLSTATAGPGGPLQIGNIIARIRGYATTRGDLDTSRDMTNNPVISAGTQTSVTLVRLTASNALAMQQCSHITADGNSRTSTTGFSAFNQGVTSDCRATNCTVNGFLNTYSISCQATGCATGFNTHYAIGCVASGGTTGFLVSALQGHISHCLAWGNTTGFSLTGSLCQATCCTSDGNTGSGFVSTSGSRYSYFGCLATNNGSWGFDGLSYSVLVNCAGFANTSGNLNGTPVANMEFKTLTASPYVNVATRDYRPNNTASAGADLRASGFAIPTQTNNQDIGALQHADPSGGGSSIAFNPIVRIPC